MDMDSQRGRRGRLYLSDDLLDLKGQGAPIGVAQHDTVSSGLSSSLDGRQCIILVSHETVRAQYKGYRKAEGIPPDSETATYAALRLYIDNWRWKGVPFYLRSGKALQKKTSEIIIQFREPPHVMFPLPRGYTITSNMLGVRVQPDEGIHLRFEAKIPDTAADMRSVNMDFRYADSFGSCSIPEAYERLLYDALNGDASLFTRSDGIEKQWQLIDPIVRGWESKHAPKLVFYERGGWGPDESDEFLARDGRQWLNI